MAGRGSDDEEARTNGRTRTQPIGWELTISRTGKLSFAEDGLKIVGAVAPGGMFGFFFDDPNPAHDFFGWDVFVRPVPRGP